MYRKGRGVTKDYKVGKAAYNRGDYVTAQRHFRPLAEQGYAKAQNSLGYMYQWGYDVRRNYAITVRWYPHGRRAGSCPV